MNKSQSIRRFRKLQTMFAAFLAGVGALTGAPMADQGVISIDFCADQYALGLLETPAIQAGSYEARGPQSYYADRAQTVAEVSGSLEELLLLSPAMVLRTWRGGPRMEDLLTRAGIASYQPPYAFDIEGNIATFKKVADVLNVPQAGEDFVADQLGRLERLKALPKQSAKAVYMTPSGFTAGTETYVDRLIKLAGFETVAAGMDIHYWVPLPLEKLLLSPPDFIVAAYFRDADVHVSRWSSGRHRVYKQLMEKLPTIHLPSRLMVCGGAFAGEAAEYIRAEADRLGLVAKETPDE